MFVRAILLIVTGVFPLPAFGTCAPEFIEHVIQSLGYSTPENFNEEYVACKVYPALEHASIIAIASKQPNMQKAEDENYNLDIALVDINSEKVLAHKFYEAKLPNGGGPRLTGIKIDTAKYVVSPNSRAFGIRASLNMGFTSSEELSLFLLRDKDIVTILSGAEMHIFFTNRWPLCKQQTREAERILIIDKILTNGFYDLLVKERVTDSEGRTDQFGNCELVPINKKVKQYRLKYDGMQYVIPMEMRDFDCRVC